MRARERWGSRVLVLGASATLGFAACRESVRSLDDVAGGAGAGDRAGAGDQADGGTSSGGAGALAAGGQVGNAAGEAGSSSDAGAASGSDRAYVDAVLADEPLVYWRMGVVSGVVPDETGGGNWLTLRDGGYDKTAGPIAGDDGGALEFSGPSGFASARDGTALDFDQGSAFTLECWAHWNVKTALQRGLLSKMYYYQNDPPISSGYALSLSPPTEKLDVWFQLINTTEYAEDDLLGYWGAIDAWTQYVAVNTGEVVALYVNGKPLGSIPSTVTWSSRAGDFMVASGTEKDDQLAMDEIAVYAHALDAQAIAKHYALAHP